VFIFLRDYKIPSGSGPNQFAFNSELQPKSLALEVTELTHEHWREAVTGKSSNVTPKGTFSIGTSSPTIEGSQDGAKLHYSREQRDQIFKEQEAFKYSAL